MIDSYLKSQSDLDDRAIHLLFSANRWEVACVSLRLQTIYSIFGQFIYSKFIFLDH